LQSSLPLLHVPPMVPLLISPSLLCFPQSQQCWRKLSVFLTPHGCQAIPLTNDSFRTDYIGFHHGRFLWPVLFFFVSFFFETDVYFFFFFDPGDPPNSGLPSYPPSIFLALSYTSQVVTPPASDFSYRPGPFLAPPSHLV